MDTYIKAILDINKDKDAYEEMVLAKPLKLDKIQKDFSPPVLIDKILQKLNL